MSIHGKKSVGVVVLACVRSLTRKRRGGSEEKAVTTFFNREKGRPKASELSVTYTKPQP
jgi:hypothetical protein